MTIKPKRPYIRRPSKLNRAYLTSDIPWIQNLMRVMRHVHVRVRTRSRSGVHVPSLMFPILPASPASPAIPLYLYLQPTHRTSPSRENRQRRLCVSNHSGSQRPRRRRQPATLALSTPSTCPAAPTTSASEAGRGPRSAACAEAKLIQEVTVA